MAEKKFPEQNELVLCTVSRILGTTVFVKLYEYDREGVIATSEVSPGRIRNIRDYVVPNKNIVCKVLRVDEKKGHIDLSLRRVKIKEKKELLERYKHEKNALTILKVVTKERADEISKKIKEKGFSLYDTLQKITEIKPQFFGLTEQEHEQLIKIIGDKPQKRIFVRKEFEIRSEAPDGIERIKSVLTKALGGEKNVKITYLSSPRYLITAESEDYKEANKKLTELKERILEEAKSKECKVEFKE